MLTFRCCYYVALFWSTYTLWLQLVRDFSVGRIIVGKLAPLHLIPALFYLSDYSVYIINNIVFLFIILLHCFVLSYILAFYVLEYCCITFRCVWKYKTFSFFAFILYFICALYEYFFCFFPSKHLLSSISFLKCSDDFF